MHAASPRGRACLHQFELPTHPTLPPRSILGCPTSDRSRERARPSDPHVWNSPRYLRGQCYGNPEGRSGFSRPKPTATFHPVMLASAPTHVPSPSENHPTPPTTVTRHH